MRNDKLSIQSKEFAVAIIRLVRALKGKKESIKKELDEHKQKVAAVSERLLNENEAALSELAK